MARLAERVAASSPGLVRTADPSAFRLTTERWTGRASRAAAVETVAVVNPGYRACEVTPRIEVVMLHGSGRRLGPKGRNVEHVWIWRTSTVRTGPPEHRYNGPCGHVHGTKSSARA